MSSTFRLPGFTASAARREVQVSTWIFSRLSLSRFMSYLPLLSFGPSVHRFRLGLSVCSTFRSRSASLTLPTTWPNTPSADFCPAVRPSLGGPSRRSDTEQISRGKFSRLPCTVAGSTPRVLDGYGLRSTLPARPTLAPRIRFLSIGPHLRYGFLHTPDLAVTALASRLPFTSIRLGGGLAPPGCQTCSARDRRR